MRPFLVRQFKKSIAFAMDFFICVVRTQHHLTEGQLHFRAKRCFATSREHHFSFNRTQMNEVAPMAQMMYSVMMLRIWRKRCCASRKWKVAFCIIIKKPLISGDFSCFLDENKHSSTLHLFPDLMDLNHRHSGDF